MDQFLWWGTGNAGPLESSQGIAEISVKAYKKVDGYSGLINAADNISAAFL